MHQIKSLVVTGPFVIRVGNTVSHKFLIDGLTDLSTKWLSG